MKRLIRDREAAALPISVRSVVSFATNAEMPSYLAGALGAKVIDIAQVLQERVSVATSGVHQTLLIELLADARQLLEFIAEFCGVDPLVVTQSLRDRRDELGSYAGYVVDTSALAILQATGKTGKDT